MSTDLLEHFNNIENKDWALYHHNIGLKPSARYKMGFVIEQPNNKLIVYKEDGSAYATSIPSYTAGEPDVLPVPSRGLLVAVTIYNGNGEGLYYFDIFDVKTGVKNATITTKSYTRGCAYDVLENGDIAILNRYSRELFLYSKDGTLKTSLSNAVPGENDNHILSACSSKKAIYLGDAGSQTGKILSSNDLSVKISNVPFSYYFMDMMEDGSVLYSGNYLYSGLSKTKIDYTNNEILSTTIIPTSLNETVIYLRTIGKKIYFVHKWSATNGLVELVEIDGNGNQTVIANLNGIRDVDDKFIYTSTGSAYKVYSRKDLSLIYSISSEDKLIRSTKGKYENFGKYW